MRENLLQPKYSLKNVRAILVETSELKTRLLVLRERLQLKKWPSKNRENPSPNSIRTRTRFPGKMASLPGLLPEPQLSRIVLRNGRKAEGGIKRSWFTEENSVPSASKLLKESQSSSPSFSKQQDFAFRQARLQIAQSFRSDVSTSSFVNVSELQTSIIFVFFTRLYSLTLCKFCTFVSVRGLFVFSIIFSDTVQAFFFFLTRACLSRFPCVNVVVDWGKCCHCSFLLANFPVFCFLF